MFFELYQDSQGEWRWRLKAKNGRTVADSGEGYTSRAAAQHGITLLKSASTSTKTITLPKA
jgi:uncharacterized protein YegP (UPF0339 family)